MFHRIRRALIAAFLLSVASLAPAQSNQITESLVLKGLRHHAERQCAKMTQVVSKAQSDAEAAALKPVVDMACECMPEVINEAAQGRPEGDKGRVLSVAEAGQLAARIQATCTARHLRQMMRQQCSAELPHDIKPAVREAYCACVGERADLTPDQAWLEASVQQHEHFMAKVRAEADGEPVPPEPQTALSTIPAECRAQVMP
ncbi:hypothetical protein WNB94_09930 [Aquabacterium sp. A3]|uniref:hypothetical protein n=1 Tax=Aquabacterium sp. A3 TaxID=3132829 RepID=UPI0031198D4E